MLLRALGTTTYSCSPTAGTRTTTRGFTNQEEIEQVGLVNLNARIYDPVLGRFMSADPTVESPFTPQDLNRYSYVGNNPLSFTDPSGLCFLGCFWQSPVFAAVVAHGMVGGLGGVIQGGHFGAGFLAAGIGSLAPAPVANGIFKIVGGDAAKDGDFALSNLFDFDK